MSSIYNIENIKNILKTGFTVPEILDIIHNHFAEHYSEQDYAGKNAMLLDKTTVIQQFVNHCQQTDKLPLLCEILTKLRPEKVKQYPCFNNRTVNELNDKKLSNNSEIYELIKDFFIKHEEELINKILNKIGVNGDKNTILQGIQNSTININIVNQLADAIKENESTTNLHTKIKLLLLKTETVKQALQLLHEKLPNENTIIMFFSEYNQITSDIVKGLTTYNSVEWRSLVNRILGFIDRFENELK